MHLAVHSKNMLIKKNKLFSGTISLPRHLSVDNVHQNNRLLENDKNKQFLTPKFMQH